MLSVEDQGAAPQDALDLQQIEKQLAEVQAYICRFQSEIADITTEHRSVGLDFNHAKDYYKKLKFTFIELATKQQFLEHIQSGIDEKYDENTIAQAIDGEKAKIRELKSKNEEQRNLINQLVNDLDRNFDPSREAMGRIATLVEDIKSLQAEIEAFSKTTYEPLYVHDQQITLENAQAMLDAQLKQMFALEDTKREQETEIAETEWKIAEVDEEIQALQKRLSEQTAALEAMTTNHDEALINSLREKKDWYDSALSLVRKMTQMSARLDRDNHKLYVDIVVANKMTRESLPYTIGVDLCPESGALKGAQVMPQTLIPVADIVEEAVLKNDAAFLVREIRQRLCKHSAVNSEVEVLKECFNIEWNPDRETVTLILPDGRLCTLELSDSLFGTGYSIRVAKMQPDDGGAAQELQSKLKSSDALHSLEKCLELCL